MKYKHQVALIKFDDSPLVPTEISRKQDLVIGKLQHHRFEFGKVTFDQRLNPSHRKSLKNYYRHFKSDLTRNKNDLRGPGNDIWSMKTKRTDEDKERGLVSELYQDGKNRTYFSALHAAEVFLYKTLERTIAIIDRLFQGGAPIHVHFTAPAFNGQDDKKQLSQFYRDYLRDITSNLKQIPPVSRVQFQVDRLEFLYEPYAIWQYYATIEEAISRREDVAGKTYLVFDMGGSTTDMAMVQVNKKASIQSYPVCRSIDRAGAYFDRFILKTLRGDEILPRPGKKNNRALEEIENAKIAICTGQVKESTIKINEHSFQIDRPFLAQTLEAFWNDPTINIGQAFRGFLTQAKRQAKRQGNLLEIDQIEGVFLAGGSTGLPGIETLIQNDLLKVGFIKTQDDAFITPQKPLKNGDTIPRSSLAALGQAAEMAETVFAEMKDIDNSLVLDRAEEIYMRVEDEHGRTYSFPRRARSVVQKDETFLFDLQELGEKQEEKFENSPGYGPYEVYSIPKDQKIPGKNRLYFRNNLEKEYPSEPNIEIKSHIDIDDPIFSPQKISEVEKLIRFTCHAERREDTLKIEPYFRFRPQMPVNSKWRRLDGKSEDITVKVSLKPESVIDKQLSESEQPVHVCIDFGMNNSAIALFAPGRLLPEEDSELEVFDLFNLQHAASQAVKSITTQNQSDNMEADSIPSQNGKLIHDNESDPVSTSANDAVHSETHWTVGFTKWAEQVAAKESTKGTDNLQPVIYAIDQLRKSLSPIQDIATSLALHQPQEKKPKINWWDELQSEMTSPDSPLGQEANEDTSFKEFLNFIRHHEENYIYSESVLQRIWTRCVSDEGQLIVLAGPPGSGKTTLVRLLAEFFNRGIDKDDFPRGWEEYYLLQPVSPAWFSPASLLGSVNPLHGNFQATTFLRFLMKAQIHYREFASDSSHSRVFFACLDEFNIAQPEQYLADLLSKLEAPIDSESRTLIMHEGQGSGGSDSVRVELTPNLKLFATLNTDVSTKSLSPKVLDRCFFLRLTPGSDEVGKAATRFAKKYSTEVPEINQFHKAFGQYFSELYNLCRLANTPIAFRTLKQVYAFVAKHPFMQEKLDKEKLAQLLEEVICSFFLPKLPGAHAINNPDYAKALKEQCKQLKGLKEAKFIIEQIESGYPGQAVL